MIREVLRAILDQLAEAAASLAPPYATDRERHAFTLGVVWAGLLVLLLAIVVPLLVRALAGGPTP
jgi:hypothetical protein